MIRDTRGMIIEYIYNKSTAKIKVDGEKLKIILVKSGTKQEFSLSPHLLIIELEALA